MKLFDITCKKYVKYVVIKSSLVWLYGESYRSVTLESMW